MKIEQQVCSLEHANRLRDLWVKQESLFVWIKIGESFVLRDVNSLLSRIKKSQRTERFISAFTVAELGEMLPQNVSTSKGAITWSCRWWEEDSDFLRTGKATRHMTFTGSNEVNARARMLIYLLENNIVK